MLRTRVIPCLLLRRAGLVKTVKFKNASYVGDPVNTVRIFNEKEVDELVLLDIRATVDHTEPQFDLVEEVASECFMPLAYGGGIREIAHMARLFEVGVEKVALNTAALDRPELVEAAAREFGSQSIIASIDVKRGLFGRYQVYVEGGTRGTGRSPEDVAKELANRGVGEILLTSIDRDGTFEGYDVDLLRSVTGSVDVPVIACGGAGSIEDFGRAVREGGASAVAAGSMVVYQGPNRAVLINFPSRRELEAALP